MDTQEAYEELGVDPGVSDTELKATWRRLVAAWHPDRNATAGADRRMQHINKAYQHIRQLAMVTAMALMRRQATVPRQRRPELLRHLKVTLPEKRMPARSACRWRTRSWVAPVPCAGTLHTPAAPV